MFKPQETQRLRLRNWKPRDRQLFYEINSDEQVMNFFPFRRNRAQSDEMMDFLSSEIEKNGHGFTAIEIKATKECIGFCGLHICGPDLELRENTVEIGWRLSPRYWGKGYASEAAQKWVEVGFDHLSLHEIVSFAVHDNHPSLAVMNRIGMIPDPKRDFDLKGISKSYSHLRSHVFYALTKAQWLNQNSNKKGDS